MPDDFDQQLRAAIDAQLKAGTRIEDIRIRCGPLEWRWSRLLKRWDLYDPAIVAEIREEQDE